MRILNAIEHGEAQAADELVPILYEELRLLAAQKLAKESPGQTLRARSGPAGSTNCASITGSSSHKAGLPNAKFRVEGPFLLCPGSAGMGRRFH